MRLNTVDTLSCALSNVAIGDITSHLSMVGHVTGCMQRLWRCVISWIPDPEERACMTAQIAALKALKLNIRRAKVKTKGSTKVNKFFITDATTAEKIMKVLHAHLSSAFFAGLLGRFSLQMTPVMAMAHTARWCSHGEWSAV